MKYNELVALVEQHIAEGKHLHGIEREIAIEIAIAKENKKVEKNA